METEVSQGAIKFKNEKKLKYALDGYAKFLAASLIAQMVRKISVEEAVTEAMDEFVPEIMRHLLTITKDIEAYPWNFCETKPSCGESSDEPIPERITEA